MDSLNNYSVSQASNSQNTESGSILIPRIIPKVDQLNTQDQIQQKTTFSEPPSVPKKTKKMGKWLKIALGVLGGLLITLIATGFMAFDLYKKGMQLKTSLQIFKDSVASQDIQKVKGAFPPVEAALADFKHSYARMAFLKIVPYYGVFYSDGMYVVRASENSIEAGKILVDTIEPYADIIGFTSNSSDAASANENAQQRIDFIIKTIPDLVPKMDELTKKVALIKSDLDQIDPNHYPEKYREYEVRSFVKNSLDQFDQAYVFIENAKPMLEVAPGILGTTDEREYLVLFQNDKELRPTGGFITAYSIAKVSNGRFEPVASDDIYNLDNNYKPNIKVPDPILKFIKQPYSTSPYLRLRDMNWNPDFSESMDLFYKEAQMAGVSEIDGIIAVDTQTLVNLLNVIGPIGVPGFGDFSSNIVPECNCPQVIYELESFADVEGAVVWSENEPGKIVFAPPNYENRKKIIGPLMNSILSNTLGQPKEKMPALFNAMFKSLAEKHVLFYFTDEAPQKAAEDFGIAGTFKETPNTDFLSIVDANLGGRKSNLYLLQDVAQEIEVDKSGNVSKTLTITYKNTEKQDGWLNSVMPNWVRIYVPKGSELESFEGVTTKVEPYEEHGKTVYAGSFELRPLGLAKLVIRYKPPLNFKDYYRIYIQKQPGKDTSLYTFTLGRLEEEYQISTDKEIKIKI